jgi:hypothetical protein
MMPTAPASDRGPGFTDMLLMQAAVAPGTGRGGLLALVQGWSLPRDLAPAPMVGHHDAYAVLLTRE